MKYVTSVERFAEARGLEKGREEGREIAIKLLERLLQQQFQEVPDEVKTRLLQMLSRNQLERLSDTALSAESLAAFVKHLPKAKQVKPEESEN